MNAIAHASALSTTGPQLDNRRVLAALIDLVIVGAGAALILFAADALPSAGGSAREEVGTGLYLITLAWALYYYFACESGAGQTLGKRLMRIRVVDVDGGPASTGAIAVRTALRLVDGLFLYLVGLIVMLATGERRGRLGDLAGHTVVVSADAPPAPAPAAPAALGAPAPPGPATITLPSREPAPEPAQIRPFEAPPQSLKELARDVPAEPPGEAVEAETPDGEDGAEEEQVVVRSPETISAMELVMEESEPAEAPPSGPRAG